MSACVRQFAGENCVRRSTGPAVKKTEEIRGENNPRELHSSMIASGSAGARSYQQRRIKNTANRRAPGGAQVKLVHRRHIATAMWDYQGWFREGAAPGQDPANHRQPSNDRRARLG
jgi:hypothetical protein